jgi:uncharacterized protein
VDLTETTLVASATILMVLALVLSFLPIMPGPVLVWAVAVIFAALEGFERMTPLAVLVVTLIMIVGSVSDFWLPFFGVRTSGVSCQSTIGAFVGGLIGTFFIPIPVVGTLIGSVGGALLVELLRLRELRQAMRAGKHAFKMYVLSYVIQLVTSIAIFVVYFISVRAAI